MDDIRRSCNLMLGTKLRQSFITVKGFALCVVFIFLEPVFPLMAVVFLVRQKLECEIFVTLKCMAQINLDV
jgi:hypothetical protein